MHTLCPIAELPPGSSRGFQIGDQSLFAVSTDEGIFVYRNRCPHLGIELEWLEHQFLDADGLYIQCATHGALFTPHTGECVAGPCIGDSLQVIPHHSADGLLMVALPDGPCHDGTLAE